MNALAERFVSSVHREELNYYLLITEKQIEKIFREYIDYYNSKRPHQELIKRYLTDINHSFMEEYKNPQFLAVYATIITGVQHDGYSLSPLRA